MQIRQLEYFVAVSEHLNFTKAAKQFHISQTAVTHQIKALEHELGVELFYRTNRKVELTPAGMVFLEDAATLLQRFKDTAERAKAIGMLPSGQLKIGYIQGYERSGFSRILSDFHKQYPNISFSLIRANVDELYDSIMEQKLDLVFNILWQTGTLHDMEYITIKKYSSKAIIPKTYPLADKKSIAFNDLKKYPLIDSDWKNSYGETDTKIQLGIEAGFILEPKYIANTLETSLLSVEAGLGYAVFPSYYTDSLNFSEKVAVIPIEGWEKRITVVAAWHRSNGNPALKIFRENCLLPSISKL